VTQLPRSAHTLHDAARFGVSNPAHRLSPKLRAAWPGALLICVHVGLAGAAALDGRGRADAASSPDIPPCLSASASAISLRAASTSSVWCVLHDPYAPRSVVGHVCRRVGTSTPSPPAWSLR
jgi:hypothetical protein